MITPYPGAYALRGRVRVREGWSQRRSPLIPALSRGESAQGTKGRGVSEKNLATVRRSA
jgi:hypothetical protein